MNLSVGHGSTFKPAVENLIDSFQFTLSLSGLNGQMVNVFSVQIINFLTCKFFQFLNWTNTDDFLSIIRNPQWDRVTPISISWEAPVFSVLQPVIESFLLNGLWNPVSFVVVLDQIFLKISNLDEPGWYSLVNQRCVTSPTERIVVNLGTTLNNSSSVFNVLYDDFVGIFDIDSFENWTFFGEFSVFINRHWWVIGVDNSLGNTDFIIFLTETWSTMDDTGTWVISNEISCNDLEATVFLSISKELEHRKIFLSFQILSFELFKNFISLFIFSVESLGSAFCQNENLVSLVILDLDVIHVTLDRQSQVWRQGPWGCGPNHEFDVVIFN